MSLLVCRYFKLLLKLNKNSVNKGNNDNSVDKVFYTSFDVIFLHFCLSNAIHGIGQI